MDTKEELNEKLREHCCLGDIDGVYKCLSKGADVNSKHKMNGWTSLHWASKRGHVNVIKLMLNASADPTLCNSKGETPLDIATNDEIRIILQESFTNGQNCIKHVQSTNNNNNNNNNNSNNNNNNNNNDDNNKQSNGFQPNYLKNPIFPYVNTGTQSSKSQAFFKNNITSDTPRTVQQYDFDKELVLKVRIAGDTDFIEVELDNDNLTYSDLLKLCLDELELNLAKHRLIKIRKLPNTIVRKDKDVMRLQKFQELELVLDKIN